MKGGLGHVNVVGSVVFAGMSGTAVADAGGLGTIEIKAMKDHGYSTEFAVGVTAASATVLTAEVDDPTDYGRVITATDGSVLEVVEHLPTASWQTAFGLGFVSAVFDNIPLTALALKQGGYDWGVLAFAVGFGGSMLWFGSSAGVALSNLYPEARSAAAWVRHGWHVAVAYVVGFAVMLTLVGWQPHAPHKAPREAPAAVSAAG